MPSQPDVFWHVAWILLCGGSAAYLWKLDKTAAMILGVQAVIASGFLLVWR